MDTERSYPERVVKSEECECGDPACYSNLDVIDVQGDDVEVALLSKVFDHITAHPDEHNQAEWAVLTNASSCGTAMCIAGHAVVMAGHELYFQGDRAFYVKPPHLDQTIAGAAQNSLGLTRRNAEVLFSGGNTLDDLWDIVSAITDGAVQRPVT